MPEVNAYRNEFEAEFAGQKRVFRADFEAICRIERQLGMGAVRLVNNIRLGDYGLEMAAVILHNCLVSGGDRSMSLKEVGEAIAERGVAEYYDCLVSFGLVAIFGVQMGKPEVAAPEAPTT